MRSLKRASLVVRLVKNPSAKWETRVGFLGREDPLEEGMETQVFLPGGFHGQRILAGYSSWPRKGSDTTE